LCLLNFTMICFHLFFYVAGSDNIQGILVMKVKYPANIGTSFDSQLFKSISSG
jgi:hypothetical protein